MYMIAGVSQYVAVASFMEAWIEIKSVWCVILFLKSPPSWRRGLKFQVQRMPAASCRRLLHGGVD